MTPTSVLPAQIQTPRRTIHTVWLGLLALWLWAILGWAEEQAKDQTGEVLAFALPQKVRAATPGASATLLPDGQWLLLGGETSDGRKRLAKARLYDPSKKKLMTLPNGLTHARARHTATLLADGRILVWGGAGRDGNPVRDAEIYDPVSGVSHVLHSHGGLARVDHSATLLADGRMLIIGGRNAQGAALSDAELFDPSSLAVERHGIPLKTARWKHRSALLPSHDVLVWGGQGGDGQPVLGAELYDPYIQQFRDYGAVAEAQSQTALDIPEPPYLVDSDPADGEWGVDVGKTLSVRFSKPLAVTRLNANSVTLIGADGPVPVTVTPTEGGLVAFVKPKQELFPGTDYTLMIQGATDHRGQALDFTAIGFRTRALGLGGGSASSTPFTTVTAPAAKQNPSDLSSPGDVGSVPADQQPSSGSAAPKVLRLKPLKGTIAQSDDGEAWVPGPENRYGRWRTGRPLPDFVTTLFDYEEPVRDRIAALKARLRRDGKGGRNRRSGLVQPAAERLGVTGVGGVVLRLNDRPLANVTVSAGGKSARTDADGRFELTGLPEGHYELVVDGSTANRPGREYLQFTLGVDVKPGHLTELTRALYVPRIQRSDWIELPSPTTAETVVTHPKLPGVEIHIPKDTVFRDRNGKIVTRIALVPVPLDRPPFPTPADFPIYFMLHPGGAVVQALSPAATSGIRIVYPNATHARGASESFRLCG